MRHACFSLSCPSSFSLFVCVFKDRYHVFVSQFSSFGKQSKRKERKDRSRLVFKRTFVLAGVLSTSVLSFMFDVLDVMCGSSITFTYKRKAKRGEEQACLQEEFCFGWVASFCLFLASCSISCFMFDFLDVMCVGRPSHLLISGKQRGKRGASLFATLCVLAELLFFFLFFFFFVLSGGWLLRFLLLAAAASAAAPAAAALCCFSY